MRADRLKIDIRSESLSNDHLTRLIDFSEAVVTQNPSISLTACLAKITRYMNVMRLNRFNYIAEIIDDRIIIKLGKDSDPVAVIYEKSSTYSNLELA